MPHSQHDPRPSDQHLRTALDHAHELSQPRPAPGYTAAWSARAAHVGDLTVLALAMRD